MRKVSILIVGAGAILVIISFLIPRPTSPEGYWTDEQQLALDEARNKAHDLSDHHGDGNKEKEYQAALVRFESEREKLDAAKSRSVFVPRLFFWLGIGISVMGAVSLAIALKRRSY